jgi:hypothetical protein
MQHQVEAAKAILRSRNIDTASLSFRARLFHTEESHTPERNGMKIMDMQRRYFFAT